LMTRQPWKRLTLAQKAVVVTLSEVEIKPHAIYTCIYSQMQCWHSVSHLETAPQRWPSKELNSTWKNQEKYRPKRINSFWIQLKRIGR
jgi:hypothetical protein